MPLRNQKEENTLFLALSLAVEGLQQCGDTAAPLPQPPKRHLSVVQRFNNNKRQFTPLKQCPKRTTLMHPNALFFPLVTNPSMGVYSVTQTKGLKVFGFPLLKVPSVHCVSVP